MNNTLFGKVVQNIHINPLCIFSKTFYLKFKSWLVIQPHERI